MALTLLHSFMRKILLTVAFLFAISLGQFFPLRTVLAAEAYERLPAGTTIESDYFRYGQSVQIDGQVNGDTFLMGGIVTVNGLIDGDLFILGGKVTINGEVTNDIRILGGDVTINGPVGRNVLLLCGNCTVSRQSLIVGSLLTAGGNLEMSASRIGKGFRFFGNRLYVNSEINNEAFVVAEEQFLLGAQSSISGHLKYTGKNQVELEPGATVGGTISYEKLSQGEDYPNFFGAQQVFATYKILEPIVELFIFVISAVIGYVLLGLFPRFFEKTASAIDKEPFAAGGWGLIAFIAVPIVAILFALTIVGLPLTLALLIIGYLVYLAASYVGAFYLGRKILLSRYGERRGWALVLGLFIFFLLGLVPIVGSVVKLIFILLALGGMFISYRHQTLWKQESWLEAKVEGKRGRPKKS